MECQLIQKKEGRDIKDTGDTFAAVGVIRMLFNMREKPDEMEKVMRLMNHLQARRKEKIWDNMIDDLIPFVMSHGYDDVEAELLESLVGIIRTNSVKWYAGSKRPLGSAVCPVYAWLLQHL